MGLSARTRAAALGLLVLALGLAGVLLGRRWRADVVLRAELLHAEERDAIAAARAAEDEGLMSEDQTIGDSSRAYARAAESRARADRAALERKAINEIAQLPIDDDLRAGAFMRRWRDRRR